jgi:hypothetical protein
VSLLGNISLLHKSPAKYTTGTVGFNDRANWNKPGMMRSRGDLTVSNQWKFDAVPSGMYAGRAFFPPQKAGALRARESFSLGGTGQGVGGITTTGTATMVLDFALATGGLIASGNGAASMIFTLANALLTASIGGTGTADFTLTGTGLLGALASGEGTAGMTITFANAQAYPLNDASPLRTGAASFAVTGLLVPYAIGSMAGSTVDTSVLTVDAIAAGVLAAALAAPIRANITKVNDVDVSGTGAPGNEWGPV